MAINGAIASEGPARYVGQPIKRIEDPQLLCGDARYIDDLSLPRMVHAAFVRSAYAHAEIRSIDITDAVALDGVIGVYTAADLEGEAGPMVMSHGKEEVIETRRSVLAKDKVRFVGEAVAVVVASTPYIAEDGRDLVRVEWEPLPVVVDPVASLEPDAPLLDPTLESNNVAHIEGSAGDVEAAFADADRVFTKHFTVGRSTGAPIEARGVLAEYEARGGGHMNVWISSQMPHFLRMLLAPMLGMPEGRVSIKVPDVGGAFGLKCSVFPEDIVVPALARKLRRPVKWIEDRYENLAASIHSKAMVCTVEIAVDDDGTFRGFRGHFITDAGGYSSMPFTPIVDSQCAGQMLPSVYRIDNVAFVLDNPLTNKCPIGAIRGVGWVPGQLARESAIDDVARELGIDAVELRLRNLLTSEPQLNAFGAAYDGGSYIESLELVRDTLGYAAFRDRQAELRGQDRYIGIGFSPFIEPTGWGTKMGPPNGLPGAFVDMASVAVEPDGSVNVTTGMHSHGQGHETTFAQVVADELGVPIESVRVTYGDTDSAAFGMGTYSSRSAVIAAGALTEAAGEVRERLLGLAAGMLEVSAEDLEMVAGRAQVKGAPDRSVPIAEVAGFGYFGAELRPESVQRSGLSVTATREPEQNYANGCAGAVVEVDVPTGVVTVEQIVACEDCGVMLNPMIVKGQVAGAVAMGLGIALLEDLVYDESGEFVSGSLMHYLFPSTTEVPMLDLKGIETPSAVTVGGVKGVGEAGTISTPAAVVNAIADALQPFGVRIDRTPVTPAYLRGQLREAGA